MDSIININDISLSFGGIKALNDVTTDIPRGKVTSIIGPNGSGKTTLFNVLTGIYKPDKGAIHFDGKEITGLRPDQINQAGISRTFQLIRLFGTMTVAENIYVGGHSLVKSSLIDDFFNTKKKTSSIKEVDDAADALIEEFGLQDIKNANVNSLPYGTKRRVEIVRALVNDPKVLLLDEPAAGMNDKETDELKQLISQINQRGHTVILVEHDLKMVLNVSDHIFVLNQGYKIAEGSPNEIKDNKEVIEAYVGKNATTLA